MWGTFDLRKPRNWSLNDGQHGPDFGLTEYHAAALRLVTRENAASLATGAGPMTRQENARGRPVLVAGEGRGPVPSHQ
jgi:hypothetical protein